MAARLADQIEGAGMTSVAVVDFADLEGNVTELGTFLAEEISLALSLSGKSFAVLDPMAIQALMLGKGIDATAPLDARAAKLLKDAVGVQGLVLGTVTSFSETIRLSAKILDTSSGKVVAAVRGDIPRSKGMQELLARTKPRPTPVPPWPPECDALVSYPVASEQEVREFTVKEYERMQAALGAKFKETWKLARDGHKHYGKLDHAAVVKIFESILARDPENWDAHYMLAACFANLKMPEKVLDHACKALKSLRDKSLHLSVAIAFAQKGDKQRALAWLERALSGGFELRKEDYDQWFSTYVHDPDYLALLSKYSVPKSQQREELQLR